MSVAFPAGFLWIAATAACQIEGASTRTAADRASGTSSSPAPRDPPRETGRIAGDHYHRVEEDLDLLAELGLSAYRFSVSADDRHEEQEEEGALEKAPGDAGAAPALPSTRMRAFDVGHEDPAPLARAAAIHSPRERDPAVRDRARRQTPAERLREGVLLARFAEHLGRAHGARR